MPGGLTPRVVEVFSASTPGGKQGSRGSGYLLADGLVLTARHVIVPDDWGKPPERLDISSRTVAAALRGEGFKRVNLVWPAYADLMKAGRDVALLRMDSGIDDTNTSPPLLGFDDTSDSDDFDPTLKVYAVGFPEFARKEGRYETNQIYGVVKPGSGQIAGDLQIEELRFGSDKISDAFDWKGFSGAALMHSRRIIGVVVAAQTSGRYDFRAIRLEPLFECTDFRDAIGKSGVVVKEPSRAEVPKIEKLVCLLDRDVQEGAFVNAHNETSAEASARCCRKPKIFLLPGAGESRHAAEDLAERFSTETLPKVLMWPTSLSGVRWINWPAEDFDLAESMTHLRGELWRELCGEGPAPTEPGSFVRLWADGTRPRLFRSDLTQAKLNGQSAQVLRVWTEFWSKLKPADQRAPAHVLMLNAVRADAKQWTNLAEIAPDVLVEALPELQMCSISELGRWLTERLPTRVAPIHTRFLDHLNTTLQREFKEKFFLRDLKLRVRSLTEEGIHG